jgi:GT2 family glycosyltransferase
MITSGSVIKRNINLQSKAETSFIIPYLGEYSKVMDLVENINQIFLNLQKTIILIDDGSVNKDFSRSLIKANRYIVVRHDKTKGFGASVNVGLRETRTKHAIICHTDIKFFDRNCIVNLLKDINKSEMEKVAVLSAVSNNPLVHENILKKKQAEDESAFVTDVSYLPFYCACVNVRALLNAGGFPEFPYAWFEDEAICHQLKNYGYKLAVSPSSYVYHEGMGTITNLVNYKPEVLNTMKDNFKLLKNFIK